MDNIQYISRDQQVAIELFYPIGFNANDVRLSFWNQPGISDVVTKRKHLKSLRELIDTVLKVKGLE